MAVEPNSRAAGLLAGPAHKGCVVQVIRCCPRSSALPLHLVLLFQFLLNFDRCRLCGQPPHISVSSQGFKVGRCNIASPEVAFADIFIPESWSTSGSCASGEFNIQHVFWYPSTPPPPPMRATWPSQRSLLFASMLNMLGTPARLRTSSSFFFFCVPMILASCQIRSPVALINSTVCVRLYSVPF